MAAAFDENPGAERDRIVGAAEFSDVLSTTSEDLDFKRVAVALGSEHIFVPGSAKEKLARRAQRREKMLNALRQRWQKERWRLPPGPEATPSAPLRCISNTAEPRDATGSLGAVCAMATAPLLRVNSPSPSSSTTASASMPLPPPPPVSTAPVEPIEPSLDPSSSHFGMMAFMEHHRSLAPAVPPPSPPPPAAADQRASIDFEINRVRDGTPGESEQAARAIAQLGSCDETRAAIVNTGGLPPLIELVCGDSPRARLAAAWALAALAVSSEASLAIVREGGVPPLVALVRDGSSAEQEPAASALSEVARVASGTIVQSSGTQPLVALFRNGSRRSQHLAAGALARLTDGDNTVADELAAFQRCHRGLIRPLVAVVRDGPRVFDQLTYRDDIECDDILRMEWAMTPVAILVVLGPAF